MAPGGSFTILGPFQIPGLSGARTVRVYTPRRGDTKRPRPALYMFDGQNVFDDPPSFAGGWHAHEAIERLSPRRHFLPVVVGIEHGGEERIDELGPWAQRGRGGKTDRLLDWMASDLAPSLTSRFGLLPGPVGAVVGGSSLGGLAALYAHFRRPDVFGGVIAMSPSLWFAQRAIFSFVGAQANPGRPGSTSTAGPRRGAGECFRSSGRWPPTCGGEATPTAPPPPRP